MENEQPTSHSEDVQQETHSDEVKSALAAFDLLPDEPVEVETDLDQEEPQELTEEEPPAIEEPTNVFKVKFNGKDVDVPEEQYEELFQKGLALDKERERKETYKSGLERAAKLAGYDNVDKYLTELDAIEQKSIQNKSNQLADLKQSMLDEYEGLGYDPAQLDEFIENNPLFQQAKSIVEREQQAKDAQKAQQIEDAKLEPWVNLYNEYPELAKQMRPDGTADWYTDEFKQRINNGSLPLDAYLLTHRNAGEERKRTEQAVLKQQRLNKRAPLSPDSLPDKDVVSVPTELSDAFALFDLNPNDAKKYIKK